MYLLQIYKEVDEILKNPLFVKVSKFQKQIFLFSFVPKKRTKLFFDFCPSL